MPPQSECFLNIIFTQWDAQLWFFLFWVLYHDPWLFQAYNASAELNYWIHPKLIWNAQAASSTPEVATAMLSDSWSTSLPLSPYSLTRIIQHIVCTDHSTGRTFLFHERLSIVYSNKRATYWAMLTERKMKKYGAADSREQITAQPQPNCSSYYNSNNMTAAHDSLTVELLQQQDTWSDHPAATQVIIQTSNTHLSSTWSARFGAVSNIKSWFLRLNANSNDFSICRLLGELYLMSTPRQRVVTLLNWWYTTSL